MPRSAAERAVSGVGRIRRRRVESIESGTTTQRTPAGTDPTGTPVAASLMNSSPLSGPPIDAFAPPTAIAIRSSGSPGGRSEEHTSELQSHVNLVCRLLLEKKKKKIKTPFNQKTKQKKKTT